LLLENSMNIVDVSFIPLDTKLVRTHRVGKRDLPTATAFMGHLSDRLSNRVQLLSDALRAH
jgi:hypothetical protein